MYIVGKYKIYLHDIQKQVEKQSFVFLSCFTANANEFDIFRQCTYIVFILVCQKAQYNCQII